MPEVELNFLVTNGFLFWCHGATVTGSQQISLRYTEFRDAMLMAEILEAKFPNSGPWSVAIEMDHKQHA